MANVSDPLPQGIQTLLDGWQSYVNLSGKWIPKGAMQQLLDQLEALATATLQEEESKKK